MTRMAVPSVGAQAQLSEKASELPPEGLKRRTARGALISCVCQASTLALRTLSMVILARLLGPADFGLVGMVTAFTGFIALFKEGGLSDASVQSASINQDQLSTLFWINLALSSMLTLACAASAWAVAGFYGEPRLFAITVVSSASFLFTGLATQHRAILLRDLRIRSLAAIDILALVIGTATSIAMAATGWGYWALVGSTIVIPATAAAGVWLAAAWIPGKPRRNCGVRGMVVYGGTITLNSVVVYVAYNVEKVLLGRFFGAEALGIYGRAFQLVSMPTESLKSAVGLAAFPALSRVQTDPARFRSFFLRLYSVFLSISIPITVACALFSEDIVTVLLGPKWHGVAGVFRLLSPTILAFALINPFGWLLYANGRVVRSLKIALMIAPVTLLGYVLGLQYGPAGVATGFSIAMVLLIVPVILWAKRDTEITTADVCRAVAPPVGSVLIGTAVALLFWPWVSHIEWPLFRLSAACSVLFGAHFVALLAAFGQRSVYARLLDQAGVWRSGLAATRGD